MGKTTIVAECGINHDGSLGKAKELILRAKEAGVDYVKFQLWQNETFPDLNQYRLSEDQIILTKKYAEKIDIGWFCTPFDIPSAEFLADLGMDIWKIPSNAVVVKRIDVVEKIFNLARGHRIFFSTGKSSIKELKLFQHMSFYDDITWLYCISKYPCPIESIFLKGMIYNPYSMEILKERLKFVACINDNREEIKKNPNIGLSDHSTTISIPVAAVALGATVIEKHLTLDRNAEGPDHKASIEPEDFKTMVSMIREVGKAI